MNRLEALRQIKKEGLSETNQGLCADVTARMRGSNEDTALSGLFTSWPLSNGCNIMPIQVPNIAQSVEGQYRLARNPSWEHRNEYLCMRWLLLCHCIEELEECEQH